VRGEGEDAKVERRRDEVARHQHHHGFERRPAVVIEAAPVPALRVEIDPERRFDVAVRGLAPTLRRIGRAPGRLELDPERRAARICEAVRDAAAGRGPGRRRRRRRALGLIDADPEDGDRRVIRSARDHAAHAQLSVLGHRGERRGVDRRGRSAVGGGPRVALPVSRRDVTAGCHLEDVAHPGGDIADVEAVREGAGARHDGGAAIVDDALAVALVEETGRVTRPGPRGAAAGELGGGGGTDAAAGPA